MIASGYNNDDLDNKIRNNDTNLISDRPCVGLDFSSLYPSIEMCYNLSPEKVIKDDNEYNKLKQKGKIF